CRSVHPHACGEQSSWKKLYLRDIHDVNRATDLRRLTFGEIWLFAGIERHQLQAVEIDRHSAVATDCQEVETLVCGGFPDHYGIASLDIGLDLFPDPRTRPGGVVADIDARSHLKQPGGKTAAQAGRGVVQHDH